MEFRCLSERNCGAYIDYLIDLNVAMRLTSSRIDSVLHGTRCMRILQLQIATQKSCSLKKLGFKFFTSFKKKSFQESPSPPPFSLTNLSLYLTDLVLRMCDVDLYRFSSWSHFFVGADESSVPVERTTRNKWNRNEMEIEKQGEEYTFYSPSLPS